LKARSWPHPFARIDLSVGGHPIPRPIGEDRGGVIGAVHHSPVKMWAGGLGAA
jgi:hypothetical protein